MADNAKSKAAGLLFMAGLAGFSLWRCLLARSVRAKRSTVNARRVQANFVEHGHCVPALFDKHCDSAVTIQKVCFVTARTRLHT